MPEPVPCRMRTRLMPTSMASSIKYVTAFMASSPLIPRTSMSCLKFSLRLSIVSRVCRPTDAYVLGSSFLGISARSRRSARILVRMSPNITVAILPSVLSIRPTDVRPFMRTVSPASSGASFSFFFNAASFSAQLRLCSSRPSLSCASPFSPCAPVSV